MSIKRLIRYSEGSAGCARQPVDTSAAAFSGTKHFPQPQLETKPKCGLRNPSAISSYAAVCMRCTAVPPDSPHERITYHIYT